MDKTELLKKIKALADRGVGGEADNAETILARLMDKYGISEDELSEETRASVEFTFSGKEQEKLLRQIVYKVTNGGTAYGLKYTGSGRKCRTTLGAECTRAEKVEIEFLLDFYKRLWEREREAFLSAFIQKHRLFPVRDDIEPTPISKEELMKLQALMQGMSDETPKKALEAAK